MKPLGDIRVIAVEQYGAGPWGSLQLADLGADVIKIENPLTGGDISRYIPPFQHGEDSIFYESFNRNKRSLGLDISCPAGREVLEDLVEQSDAVYSNLRGDVPEALKLTYDDLKHRNPQIVCCSLSAFGMTGPRQAEPGYDYILQGMAGWMSVTGEPDARPQRSGLSMVDFSGGFVAALALVSGVHAARRDGFGTDCDLSLFDTAYSLLNYPAAWHLTAGFEPERTRASAHPSLIPFQLFETADRPVIVACAKEKFWVRFCDAIEHPEYASDERFVTFADRDVHRDELLPLLDAAMATQNAAHWLAVLAVHGVPCGPVNDLAAAMNEPQVAARDLIIETEHPHFGSVRQIASPVRMRDVVTDHQRAPQRNEHADAILGEMLGYDSARRSDLAARGAFGE